MEEIAESSIRSTRSRRQPLGQGWLGYLKEMFLMPNNFYRIYSASGPSCYRNGLGAQSITLYTSDFFALLGTEGQKKKLFTNAISASQSSRV